MAAWISGLSLALLALVAAITAFLGWRRSTLFRESFPSLSIELNQEHIWADPEWTLLVLTAKLKNTSQVLVKIEAVAWKVDLLIPGTLDTVELYASPESSAPLLDFYLEPQQEYVTNAEVWLPTPEKSRPAFAQIVVQCPPRKNASHSPTERRIHFLLGEYHAQS